jgi:hypothetical protein
MLRGGAAAAADRKQSGRRFFPNKNSFRKSVSNPAETKKYGRVIASSDICCTGPPGRLV